MTAASTNGVVAEQYVYDVAGRRVMTVSGGVTNWHVYAGPHVVADLDASGAMVRSYVWGPGIDNLLAIQTYTNSGGSTFVSSVFCAIKDHLGSVLAMTDSSGNIVESYRYDAWGRTTVYNSNNQQLSNSAIGNRYCWQGREYSWVTGLYNFRARWYDPVTGRWLSNDPIGISGGLNQYVAFANNPVNFIDPFGLDWFDNTANFMAGAGDVLSFGATRAIRNSFPDFYMQDYSSGAYKGGEVTGMGYSLALGGGRLAYAGAAKGGSMLLLRQGATEANAIKALAYRDALKRGFNLGLTSNKAKTMEWALGKYGNYADIIKAAGRTNPEWNLLGGYLFSAGLTDFLSDKPGTDTSGDQCK